jgi:hypothetical protein
LEKKPKRESWDLFREACCSRGSRCAQPRDISWYSLFSQILEEKQSRIEDMLMQHVCPISDLTMDKPWNDLSRAWNDLSRAWTEFSTDFIFYAKAKIWIPQKRATIWVSLWILLMAQEFKHIQFEGYYIIGPDSGPLLHV